jgi:CheY-like chemotaxis protein
MSESNRSKILIIDDQEYNVILLCELLCDEFECATAYSGKEAFEIIPEFMPDIILLDILMPVMDGFEVLKQLKTHDVFKRIPVIMVTAKIEKQDVQFAIDIGAFDFVKKPIDHTELLAKIDVALLSRKRIESLEKDTPNDKKLYEFFGDIDIARRIQLAVLPDSKTVANLASDAFFLYLPKDVVGGDFCWTHNTSDELILSIFDSTGHGVPGAMISLMGFIIINELFESNINARPSEILYMLKRKVAKYLQLSDDTFVSISGMDGIYCKINKNTYTAQVSGAIRPLIIIREGYHKVVVNDETIISDNNIGDKFLFRINTSKHSITSDTLDLKFDELEIQLQKGDRLYFYTDGITNQLGGENEMPLGTRKLLNTLLLSADLPLASQKKQLYNKFVDWKSYLGQTDDILVLGVEI